MTYAIAMFIVIAILLCAAAVVSLFANLLRLADSEPGHLHEIDVNDYAPTDEGWTQAQREYCPPGSICVPSRDNLITGMTYSIACTTAALEEAANIHAIFDGIDHGAEGSSLDDSRRQLSAEDASLLLGYGSITPRALPAGDDHIDGIVREIGDREALHW